MFYPVPVTLPSKMAPGISIGYLRATHGRTSSHGSSAYRACATSRGRGEGQRSMPVHHGAPVPCFPAARLGDEIARKILKLPLPFRTPVRLTCVHAAMTRPQARRPLLTGPAVFAHNRYPCSCRRSCTYRRSLGGGSWMTRVEGVDPERTDKRIRTVQAAQAEKWGAPLLNHLIYARRPTIFHGARAMWGGWA